MTYVRFQNPLPDELGRYVGVFGLVNTLAKRRVLTEEQERFRRLNNDLYDSAYDNPAAVDATVYDHDINPGAAAWFKPAAQHLIDRVDGYLEILAAHGVECVRVDSHDPGRVIYEDDHQIVVVPR
ncbi:hypothetical protein Lfu02_61200 [Longispora fulva]|uniref:Uncharacterized protein n=1 Tax=Longispora fulva TaxID=619741 RepID=A0A8J7KIQ6_9ACTN|nr:hypothetical protein [Longispora fulva]MBG6134541.1 hypothetical protein [Longispora fulva]GIG61748.1 hypothetical protein Lfu02_61200 [Longispora fulva]